MRHAGSADLVRLLEEAGLDGRGGGGFSTAVKVRLAIEHRAELIVNGCDGEIGSGKDAFVLIQRLGEVRYAASLIGSPRVRYAVHRGSAVEAVLRRAGLDVLAVPRRYVSSEASALVSLASGGLAKPLTKRQPLVTGVRGPDGRRLPPTLVLNAETLLRIAQIVEHGPRWFRSFGTADEPGPRLVTISGAIERPGVYETSAGTPLSEVLGLAGEVAPGPVHAGGLAGGWVAANAVDRVPWSREGLARSGASTGAGTLTVLDPGECPLQYASELLDFAAGESAGQCGPCMFGLPAIAADLRAGAAGDVWAIASLQRRLPLLAGRGACHFPDGVARFAAGTLMTFADHLDEHLVGGCRRGRNLVNVGAIAGNGSISRTELDR